MATIYDVRKFNAADCFDAIKFFEDAIARGDKSYIPGLKILKARLDEINGVKKVEWITP